MIQKYVAPIPSRSELVPNVSQQGFIYIYLL